MTFVRQVNANVFQSNIVRRATVCILVLEVVVHLCGQFYSNSSVNLKKCILRSTLIMINLQLPNVQEVLSLLWRWRQEDCQFKGWPDLCGAPWSPGRE